MANPKKTYMDRARATRTARPAEERVKDYREIYPAPADEHIMGQADRCMDCGVPFCQAAGCPMGNTIPEFNDAVSRGRWKEACDLLHVHCCFPEFTGRLCPAPCEFSCTLGVNFEPVTIRELEWEIVERGFKEGYIVPHPPAHRTGKKAAVIGSGPAGLAAAQRLNWAGHTMTVFESDDRLGGFLRYGVPDFKMEKWVVDRRIDLLRNEGVLFETGVRVGEDISAKYLREKFDAVCLCSGARAPRDLKVPGRELKGIYFAMEYLEQSNRRQADETIPPEREIDAKDKIALILGGGDTGADCVGTANRQGSRQVMQFELLPKPPENRTPDMPWPYYPMILRTSTSHQEGCERRWSINTKSFQGENGALKSLTACELDWTQDAAGRWQMKEKPGTDFTMDVDLVLLALGFLYPAPSKLLTDLGVALDERGNVKANAAGMTSVEGVFAAGDVAMGATLVVRAMAAGKRAAEAIRRYLANR
ncbi:MAG: glutamate synthase subunit beta [Candidatus Sumerlaeota bacterium]|nr:glutamate synthase subunit beta [Candidatus Sumerlaeota bacterium]